MTKVRAALDPAILVPPTESKALERWERNIRNWSATLHDGPVQASCPKDLQFRALSDLFQHQAEISAALSNSRISALGFNSLVTFVERLRGALSEDCSGCPEVLWSRVATSPEYAGPPQYEEPYTEHLADIALAATEAGMPCATVTAPTSWTVESRAVEVDAVVAMLDSPCSTIGSAGETLHKWIHRWDAPSEITQCLRESPLTLIAYPQYGVDAMAERVFRGQAFQLSYAISDTFVASLEAKTYGSSPGRLAACFRAMAFIAAGRAGALTSLKAHAQHEKEGGGSRPLRDARGRTLYRGYLANNTPNAHRIVWWGGAKPEFVAVLGHDESPPI